MTTKFVRFETFLEVLVTADGSCPTCATDLCVAYVRHLLPENRPPAIDEIVAWLNANGHAAVAKKLTAEEAYLHAEDSKPWPVSVTSPWDENGKLRP